MFGMDPVVVADEPDLMKSAFRLEAHNAEVGRLNELNNQR